MLLKVYSIGVLTVFFCLMTSNQFVHCLDCYQCNSSDSENNLFCSQPYLMSLFIQPKPCDNTFNAKYCIKVVSRYSTISRYCSSSNLGDSCEINDYTGGDKEQRVCVYTCSTDGCNNAFALFTYRNLFTLLFAMTASLAVRL